jgi:hypothetical protein
MTAVYAALGAGLVAFIKRSGRDRSRYELNERAAV